MKINNRRTFDKRAASGTIPCLYVNQHTDKQNHKSKEINLSEELIIQYRCLYVWNASELDLWYVISDILLDIEAPKPRQIIWLHNHIAPFIR